MWTDMDKANRLLSVYREENKGGRDALRTLSRVTAES